MRKVYELPVSDVQKVLNQKDKDIVGISLIVEDDKMSVSGIEKDGIIDLFQQVIFLKEKGK